MNIQYTMLRSKQQQKEKYCMLPLISI
jgi:hypothetical protein